MKIKPNQTKKKKNFVSGEKVYRDDDEFSL